MATLEERVQALEQLLSAAAGTAPYNSSHTGPQIDSAVSRALPGGEIDGLLAGKAPDGFGLGTNAKLLTSSDDLNNVTACGWYQWDIEPANGPGIANGQMIVLNGVYGLVTQVIYNTKGTTVQRSCYYGTWQPWEWVNPLMELGKPYRTTERYLDKPVYVKAVDCGAMPASTYKAVAHGIENVSAIVSCTGYFTNGNDPVSLPYARGTITNVGSIWASKVNIVVWADNSDYTDYNAYGIIKYTKTTD